MHQTTGPKSTAAPLSTGVSDTSQSLVSGLASNFGFPLEAAFAQLEGYARHLVSQTEDPHCKMQLERVRTAALDLAAAITSEMLNTQSPAKATGGVRRTSQPALIDLAQLDTLLAMAGPTHRDRLLSQLAVDLSTARESMQPGSVEIDKRAAACTAMSVAEAIGAQRAARLSQDLLDGVDQNDTRKCGIVAEMLSADLAELIELLSDLSPAANTRPAE